MELGPLDPIAAWDMLEIIFGFLLGITTTIATRIKLLSPRDLTILLQVLIFSVRVLRWVVKQHHPIKKTLNRTGVDQDLTRMHEQILKEHNLADKTLES